MKRKITKTIVDAMRPGDEVWDTEVSGFGVRCQVKQKVYILKRRIKGARPQLTIGAHGSPWTVVAARKEAQRLLGEIAAGATMDTLRPKEKKGVTVLEFGEKYLSDYAEQKKKPRSVKSDRSMLMNHIYPVLGDKTMEDITTHDIDQFLRAVASGKTADSQHALCERGGSIPTGGKGVANRCRALLSKMFNLAEDWGWRTVGLNPVRRTIPYTETPVERFLTDAELERLFDALDEHQTGHPYAVSAIRFAVLTGMRRGELLELKWSYVDEQRSVLTLPDSKTGRKTLRISDAAIEFLRDMPRIAGNPYVFCGHKEGQGLFDLNKPWNKVRESAGLDDVRFHDLRHTFASLLGGLGKSLPVIGKLMGHKSPQTTQRYVHLTDASLSAATNELSNKIESLRKKANAGA